DDDAAAIRQSRRPARRGIAFVRHLLGHRVIAREPALLLCPTLRFFVARDPGRAIRSADVRRAVAALAARSLAHPRARRAGCIARRPCLLIARLFGPRHALLLLRCAHALAVADLSFGGAAVILAIARLPSRSLVHLPPGLASLTAVRRRPGSVVVRRFVRRTTGAGRRRSLGSLGRSLLGPGSRLRLGRGCPWSFAGARLFVRAARELTRLVPGVVHRLSLIGQDHRLWRLCVALGGAIGRTFVGRRR